MYPPRRKHTPLGGPPRRLPTSFGARRYIEVDWTGLNEKATYGVFSLASGKGNPTNPSWHTGRRETLHCERGPSATYNNNETSLGCKQRCEVRQSFEALGLGLWYTGGVLLLAAGGITESEPRRILGGGLCLGGILLYASALAIFADGMHASVTLDFTPWEETAGIDTADYGVCRYIAKIDNVLDGGLSVEEGTENPGFGNSLILGITAVCLGGLSSAAFLALSLNDKSGDYKEVPM